MIRGTYLFLVFFLLISIVYLGSCSNRKEDPFSSKLLHLVRECIAYNDSLSNKEEIYSLIDQLEDHHFVVEKGGDGLRLKFVNFQAAVEHILACSRALKDIDSLVGMIHTPMPATPLCTKPDAIDTTLLDPSIRHDPDKLLTVRSRAQIIREYLENSGKLYIVYPNGGLEKRSKEQQSIYLQELKAHKDHLIDWVLQTKEIHSDMIGAIYFFRNTAHEIYAFSIKSYQANDPKESSEWGIWFGKIKESIIMERLKPLLEYFRTNGGPSLKEFNLNKI